MDETRPFGLRFENLITMPLSSLRLEPIKVQVAGCSRSDAEAGMLTLNYDTQRRTISGLKEELNALKLNADKIVVTVNYLSVTWTPRYWGCGNRAVL